jgi:hypothetical protein
MKLNHLIPYFLIIFVAISCIDPFDLKYDLNKPVFSIDAQLSNLDQQVIQLTESINEKGTISPVITPIKGAKVEVIINDSERVIFKENQIDPGLYFGPANFRAEPNKSYQIEITRANGVKYQSSRQKMPKIKSPENSILNVMQIEEIKDKSISLYRNTTVGFHNIYLDFKDQPGKGDNYSWTWTLFEENPICKTCDFQKKYVPFPFPGTCTRETVWKEFFDYFCDSRCWKIYRSTTLNIFNDEFSDGNIVKNRFIAQIPYYQYNFGALIEIIQNFETDDTYFYKKIITDQNDKSGGLADTPPASFFSNIKPLVPSEELIAGHFNVCYQTKTSFWLKRKYFLDRGVEAIGLLDGRLINKEKAEPLENPAFDPPTAPCLESYISTKNKPKDWVEPE